MAGHPSGERFLGRTGEDPEGAGDRIGARRRGGSEHAQEMVEPKIALDCGAGGCDHVRRLAQVLAMAYELEGTERLRGSELRLGQRLGQRLRVARKVERLDRHHVALYRKGAKQELGEAARLLGIGVGLAALGNIARDACQGLTGTVHDAINLGWWCEQTRKVANGELDPIQNVRQRSQITELREPSQRLHSANDVVERLPLAGACT
jgi:hypothetical protein